MYSNEKADISPGDVFLDRYLCGTSDKHRLHRHAAYRYWPKNIAKVRITNISARDDEVITFSKVYVTESSHIFLINGCRVLLPGRSCNWFIQSAPRQNQSYLTQFIFEGMNARTGQVIAKPIKLVGQGFAASDPSRGRSLAGVSR